MFEVKHFEEIGSTNTALIQDIESGQASSNICYHTDRQTAGRGRYNRIWSDGQGNLMMSFSLYYPDFQKRGFLSYIMAVTLHEAISSFIAEHSGDKPRLEIKWPNDILLNRQKLSGILIEATGEYCVIGMGVNIAQAPNGAARLADYTNASVSPVILRDKILETVEAKLALFEREGFEPIAAQWQALSLAKGTEISVSLRHDKIEGTIEGLDPQGRLVVNKRDGSSATLSSGDVFLLTDKD
tara:strand:- start:921 stop:1643 length:723 start_codon:yes stop_codon:yes gene_type:complete